MWISIIGKFDIGTGAFVVIDSREHETWEDGYEFLSGGLNAEPACTKCEPFVITDKAGHVYALSD